MFEHPIFRTEVGRATGRLRTAVRLAPGDPWAKEISIMLDELERIKNDNAHLRHEKALVWRQAIATPWYRRLLTFLTRRGA